MQYQPKLACTPAEVGLAPHYALSSTCHEHQTINMVSCQLKYTVAAVQASPGESIDLVASPE